MRPTDSFPLRLGWPTKTRLTALCMLGAFATSGCGGGSNESSEPFVPTPPVAAPSASESAAVFGLLEAAGIHLSLSAAPLMHVAVGGEPIWTDGPCVFGQGSLQARLDGSSAPKGTHLPPGAHSFEVTFADCLVDGLSGITLTGRSALTYDSTDAVGMTVVSFADAMRGTLLAMRSALHDVTAQGAGTLTRSRTGPAPSETYAPAAGATLQNNKTGNVATFQGGAYARTEVAPPAGASAATRQEFTKLTIILDGRTYEVDGRLDSVYGFTKGQDSHTGEVRVTRDGALAARVYGDAEGALKVEVLGSIGPF